MDELTAERFGAVLPVWETYALPTPIRRVRAAPWVLVARLRVLAEMDDDEAISERSTS